jgi:hypothetical protein
MTYYGLRISEEAKVKDNVFRGLPRAWNFSRKKSSTKNLLPMGPAGNENKRHPVAGRPV